jgi:Tfp pilus assembly protein PilF
MAVALFLSLAGFAQTSNLTGNVKGPDGKPLVGAQVKIDRTDIKNTYTVKTDKNGHFLYANLPTGVYNITIQVAGKDVAQLPNLHPKQGDNVPLNIDLSKPPEPVAAVAGVPGLSAEELAARRKAEEEAMAKDKALQEAFDLGMKAKTAKSWDAAIDSLKKASEIAPKQHVVWANLGEVYASRAETKKGSDQDGDIKESLVAYTKAVELKPEDSVYHNNYARSLARSKKFDEAWAEMAKAAQLDQLQAGGYYYNLGTLFVNMGSGDQGELAFKKAIDVDPNYADAYYQYAITLISKATVGKDNKIIAPAGTEEALQKYLSLKPTGQDADTAKAMLESMGTPLKTTIDNRSSKGGKK